MQVKREAPVLMPYRSSGEFKFSRGAGITFGSPNWEATIFGSFRNWDASSVDSNEVFSAWRNTGTHRTEAEWKSKNALGVFSGGGSFKWTINQLRLGANFLSHRFSADLKKSNQLYNKFAPKGSVFNSVSLDYEYTLGNVHIFGELASDRFFKKAHVHGLVASIDQKIDFSAVYRNIVVGFQSITLNSFTEMTGAGAEHGLYLGLSYHPNKQLTLSLFSDVFRFPWLQYRINSPCSGQEALVSVEYTPDKQVSGLFRFGSSTKSLNIAGVYSSYPQQAARNFVRFQVQKQFTRGCKAQIRYDAVWRTHGKVREEGFQVFAQADYNNERWGTNFRVQYYDTDSYNTRIYVGESDVLYAANTAMVYGRGFRTYLNFFYEWQNLVKLSLKASWDRVWQNLISSTGLNWTVQTVFEL
jgi:hypothetical protein